MLKLQDEDANFVAIGKCKQGTCQAIPILEWVNRDIDYARDAAVEKNRVIYTDLMFSSKQAFRVWPEIVPLWPESDPPRESTVEIEAATIIAAPEPEVAASAAVIGETTGSESAASCDAENIGSERVRPRDRKKAETAERNQEIFKEAAQYGLDNKTAAAEKIARKRSMMTATVYRIISREAHNPSGQNS